MSRNFYREGRANADGKTPFPNSLDPPLSVFKLDLSDGTTRSPVNTTVELKIDSNIHSF